MKRCFFFSSLALLLALSPSVAHAQYGYGYPRGYGGYGWGGWGGTVQGSMARGMGMFSMGRGMYNVDTAEARSMNVNTLMRWNAAVDQGQREDDRIHQRRMQQRRAENIKDSKEIQDRLRNHPETRDITDGDALNVLLDVLLNPAMVDRSLQYIKTPLRPDLIANIPFEVASECMTVCLDSMTMDGQWPLALRDDAFAPQRQALRQAVQAALKEDEKGDLEPETIDAVGTAMTSSTNDAAPADIHGRRITHPTQRFQNRDWVLSGRRDQCSRADLLAAASQPRQWTPRWPRPGSRSCCPE